VTKVTLRTTKVLVSTIVAVRTYKDNAIPDNDLYSCAARRTQYDRLSQQQLSWASVLMCTFPVLYRSF